MHRATKEEKKMRTDGNDRKRLKSVDKAWKQRDAEWDVPIAPAIFVTHSLTLSTAYTFVGIVGTSTMLTVRVEAPASSVEITIVTVFNCRPEVKLAILSSEVIAAKAFVPIIHAWIILTGAPVAARSRSTSIDWELALVSAPIPITLAFISLFRRIVFAAPIQARVGFAIIFLFLTKFSFVSRITSTEVARRPIDTSTMAAAEIR